MDRGGRLLVNAAQWAEELATAAVSRKTLRSLLEKRIQLELAEKVGAEEVEKRALGLLVRVMGDRNLNIFTTMHRGGGKKHTNKMCRKIPVQ